LVLLKIVCGFTISGNAGLYLQLKKLVMIRNKAVKFFLTGFGVLALTTGVFAQPSADNNAQATTINDLQLNPMRLPSLAEVNGSPFLTSDYQVATIELADKRLVKNIPVKFNIFNNAVMVSKDGQDMKLELFETVTYTITGNDGNPRTVTLKQGYPEIDNHNDRAVYQVLSMGPKVHLLKFMTQKIEDVNTLGDYSRREIVTSNQLYVYTPGGEIKKISTNKKSLVEALPALSSKIDEVVSANKINLKSESGIAELVEALNRP
jgi:hypothetical protein